MRRASVTAPSRSRFSRLVRSGIGRRRIGRATAVAASLAVLLAGCVGIPASGGVNTGPLVSSGTGGGAGVDLPQGPPKNASQDEIFDDFLQALTSPLGNYEVAKEFLTTKASQSWDPTKSVLIRERPANPQDVGDNSVAYTVSTNASVNALGVYSQQSTESNETFTYSFSKVKGQWRISALPDGIVLSTSSFNNTFGEYPIYFFDPDYRYLVPDVRWFPTGSTVPDRIVSALIAGPSDWLQQGIVTSAFPTGVKVGSPVVVSSSSAVVDFSADAASTKSLQRARMSNQLTASLKGDALASVAMTAHGAPIAVTSPNLSEAKPAVAQNSAPLLVKSKQFGFYPGLAAIGSISSQVVALEPTAVVLDRAGSAAAVLATAGVYRVTGSGAPKLVDSRPGLVAPSIDSSGFVWSVPRAKASSIIVVGADGVVHAVASDIPGKSTIVAMSVSRDGTRLLEYLQTASGPRLIVAGIIRAAGVPTSLGQPLDLPVGTAQPLDATWVDPSTVAALTSADGEDSVVSYVIGGPPSSSSSTEGAVHLAGAADIDSLRLITNGGQVQQLRASGWQDMNVSATVLATQQ